MTLPRRISLPILLLVTLMPSIADATPLYALRPPFSAAFDFRNNELKCTTALLGGSVCTDDRRIMHCTLGGFPWYEPCEGRCVAIPILPPKARCIPFDEDLD